MSSRQAVRWVAASGNGQGARWKQRKAEQMLQARNNGYIVAKYKFVCETEDVIRRIWLQRRFMQKKRNSQDACRSSG